MNSKLRATAARRGLRAVPWARRRRLRRRRGADAAAASRRRRREPREEDQGRPRHGHRRSERPRRSTSSRTRASSAPSRSSASEIRVITSDSNSDYVPNLSTLARQQYDLVVANGFLMAEATENVAKTFPDTKFAIIDFPQAAMESKPKNVEGLLFKEARRATSSATWRASTRRTRAASSRSRRSAARRSRRSTHYIAGYQTGAAEANPEDQDAQRLFARTSSTRPSARRSRSTRSPRARRSCSRSPASAASARSTRPSRRACRASASTPTRRTSATTS